MMGHIWNPGTDSYVLEKKLAGVDPPASRTSIVLPPHPEGAGRGQGMANPCPPQRALLGQGQAKPSCLNSLIFPYTTQYIPQNRVLGPFVGPQGPF